MQGKFYLLIRRAPSAFVWAELVARLLSCLRRFFGFIGIKPSLLLVKRNSFLLGMFAFFHDFRHAQCFGVHAVDAVLVQNQSKPRSNCIREVARADNQLLIFTQNTIYIALVLLLWKVFWLKFVLCQLCLVFERAADSNLSGNPDTLPRTHLYAWTRDLAIPRKCFVTCFFSTKPYTFCLYVYGISWSRYCSLLLCVYFRNIYLHLLHSCLL